MPPFAYVVSLYLSCFENVCQSLLSVLYGQIHRICLYDRIMQLQHNQLKYQWVESAFALRSVLLAHRLM